MADLNAKMDLECLEALMQSEFKVAMMVLDERCVWVWVENEKKNVSDGNIEFFAVVVIQPIDRCIFDAKNNFLEIFFWLSRKLVINVKS